ncbi:MAG: hypothetical protein HYZ11_13715 [Candidatus Tectomicrobia bacterium]|uniref:Uncharacterized protein n=1 Tax=Tectimicrobiota bacterium TaxID=2528274 RepID=A0A932HZQ7_UNCTE|nr:hypothetical protein [Candidatus Tectomicrobia bacterium]
METEFQLGGQANQEGTERVDVVVVSGRGERALELRLMGWGQGLGWYVQKSIRLDRRQAAALRELLGVAGALVPSPRRAGRSASRAGQSAAQGDAGIAGNVVPLMERRAG